MLNHLRLCMGKTSSYNLVTLFGNDYDAKVLSWMTKLIPNPLSVCIMCITFIKRNH